jgi:hypothetical protein
VYKKGHTLATNFEWSDMKETNPWTCSCFL